MTLHEAGLACEHIIDRASPDAEVIFGATIDSAMGDKMQITPIATGVEKAELATVTPVVKQARPEPAVRLRHPETTAAGNARRLRCRANSSSAWLKCAGAQR